MKPGQLNFLVTQSNYQHTVNINFKKKWYQRVNKAVELSIAKIIVFSALIIFAENILTYAGKCLFYYTHN